MVALKFERNVQIDPSIKYLKTTSLDSNFRVLSITSFRIYFRFQGTIYFCNVHFFAGVEISSKSFDMEIW